MVSLYDLKVECEECGAVAQPDGPENRLKWIVGMALVFGGLGFAIGTAVGIATAGVGFAAYVITLPIGLYIGYKVGEYGAELMDGPSCPECDANHSGSGMLPF